MTKRRLTPDDSARLAVQAEQGQDTSDPRPEMLDTFLASGAIPRVTLERYLLRLHDDLSRLMPERRDDLEKLRLAAEELRRARGRDDTRRE